MKSAVILAALLTLPSIAAHAAVGDWVKGQRAEVRLLASGIGADGKLAAGVEIALPDGWTTYWRNPGDAGIAPLFDFRASQNVGATEIAYPVPTRQDDGADTVTNVYVGSVVFPVSIAIPDPSRPIDVGLTLHLGVCQQVCVPEDVSVTLAVPAGERDAAADKEISAARARVPGATQPGAFALDTVTRNGGTDRGPSSASPARCRMRRTPSFSSKVRMTGRPTRPSLSRATSPRGMSRSPAPAPRRRSPARNSG
ncbi:MAG: protein-disulfide reductase DsbD domain-containing protein [Bauldia sp.]